ncbi:MAG: CPBP family intramembrane metalloprotease [Sinomonas sp.]|nr:CPBP family intramembrane metalloprotease [Sinomonas sp.]
MENALTRSNASFLVSVDEYLATWIPLVAALTLSFWGERVRDVTQALGLRFHPLDLLWGIGIGCVGRAADATLRLLVTGSTGAGSAPTLSAIGGPDIQTTAVGILAPVIIAPLLEELYFRGLIQRSLAEAFSRLGTVAKWAAAVVLTSTAFAAVHTLLLLAAPSEALLAGVSTFVFALAAGTTAAATNRLGGAMVGHVVFNGLGVLLAWPA